MHDLEKSDLNNIDNSSSNKIILNELKNENELMQAMVIKFIFHILVFHGCLKLNNFFNRLKD